MYLTQGLRRGARTTPDDPCLVSGARQWNWAETRDRVARLAGALHALGLEPGDRVAMLSLNSHRYFEYLHKLKPMKQKSWQKVYPIAGFVLNVNGLEHRIQYKLPRQ